MVLKEPYTQCQIYSCFGVQEVTGQQQVTTVPSEIIYTHAGILNEGEMLSILALDILRWCGCTRYKLNMDNYRIIVTDMSVEATAVKQQSIL
jgi:hypothetical protein